MNLARARELGISRQVEPALRGVTHVSTPRVRRRRSRRLTVDEGAQGAQGVAAAEPAAAASGDASESSGEESDEAHASDLADGAPQDAGEAEAAAVSKPGVTRPRDGEEEDGAAASQERAADGDASCSAAAAAPNLPPVAGLTSLDAANWMGQLAAALWHLPLHKIRMPGTHDSGACRWAPRRCRVGAGAAASLLRCSRALGADASAAAWQAHTRSASDIWRPPSCRAGWCA